MITILFLGANPTSTTRIALDIEVREITDRIRRSGNAQRFRIAQEWAVQLSDLQAALLRHQPTIVHFSGHGVRTMVPDCFTSDVNRDVVSPELSGSLVIEGDDGAAVGIQPQALASLFAILQGDIKCVVLNACYSEAQAREIRQYIDCVVGMDSAIEDRVAVAFSSSFYQALAFGKDYETAFQLGKNEIALLGLPNADAPKLLIRQGAEPRHLVLAAPPSWMSVARLLLQRARVRTAIALAALAVCGLSICHLWSEPAPKSWGFWRVQIDLPGERFARGVPLELKVRSDHAGYVWVFSPDNTRPILAWPHPDDERLSLNTIDANEWRPIPLLGHDNYGIAAAATGVSTTTKTEELILIVTAEPEREAALRHLAAMRPDLDIKAAALATGNWGASTKLYQVLP